MRHHMPLGFLLGQVSCYLTGTVSLTIRGLFPRTRLSISPRATGCFIPRSTQSAQGRAIGDLVNLSRHRRHTLIFDVQNAAHLDRNIISEVDLVLVKQPGPLQQGFERGQLTPIMDSARAAFAGVTPAKRKRCVWVFAPNAGVEGKLLQNELASFWSERLSTIFGETVVSLVGGGQSGNVSRGQRQAGNTKTATPRRGQKTPTDIKREKSPKDGRCRLFSAQDRHYPWDQPQLRQQAPEGCKVMGSPTKPLLYGLYPDRMKPQLPAG